MKSTRSIARSGSRDIPIFRQIYERMRAAILKGDMPPGSRVPSWDDMASEFKVSRGTVKAAYDCLAGEGFLVGRGAAGTFVSDALSSTFKHNKRSGRRIPATPASTDNPLNAAFGLKPRGDDLHPFQMGVPAFDEFPRAMWNRLIARHARSLNVHTMSYQPAAGDPQLRAAIAAYLAVARGVACSADQVFITSGYKGGLELIARVLLRAGDCVAVEDPGYPPARVAMQLCGMRVAGMRVDEEGVKSEALSTKASKAKLAIVTPSHHAPLGMPLSLPRRLALLDWAERQNAWIVEDDYYGEFRLHGRPLPALASLNQARVIYAGTFSKVLLPSLRLGYIVVPRSLQSAFLQATYYLAPSPAPLLQAVAAEFIQQGHFARHIRRMSSLYRERRVAMIKALQTHFGSGVELRESALHIALLFASRLDDVKIAARAADVGLAPSPLTPWFLNAKGAGGLLLSFANIAKKDANRYARMLAEVVKR